MFLDEESHKEKLKELFETYNEALKPLIAEVEVCYEEFPSPVFNEIRAFNDHIARCFIVSTDIENELSKSEGHLKRIILDCFKYLNVYNHNYFEVFDNRYKNVDLSTVKDGEFLKEYTVVKKKFKDSIREAKKNEGRDMLKSFQLFEEAYNYSKDLVILIEDNHYKLWRSKAKFTSLKIVKIVLWLLSIIATSIITYYFEQILNFIG
ncbi:MAG: hypothetical protein JXR64_11890 [Spirochaetales bacterium]|nr:hypothetical protein [Spirochaetales bacterium]